MSQVDVNVSKKKGKTKMTSGQTSQGQKEALSLIHI